MAKAYLNLIDAENLEKAAKNSRDMLLIHLLHRLGCRITEELGISTDDIDFNSGKITIVHLKSRVYLNCRSCGNKLGLKHDFCPRCGAKSDLTSLERSERRRQRQLPLDHASLDMIKTYIEQGGPILRNGKMYLFNINRHRAWQIVKECAKKAGLSELTNPETGKIRGISPHRIRDAFAVHAMKVDDSGEGMRMLQEHLGHSSFNTTAKYRKIASEEHRSWYEKLWRAQPEKNENPTH
jgi:integrase/recombinase XerD